MSQVITRSDAVDLSVIATALRRHKTAIAKRASKECWPFAEHETRGGKKRLFVADLLPADVRDAIRRARAIAAAEQVAGPSQQAGASLGRKLAIADAINSRATVRAQEQGAAAAAGLIGKRKGRMEAKQELLQRLAAFAGERSLGTCAAMDDFCAAYNSGELTVPLAVREHTGASLHPATLRRWRKQLKTQGAQALAGNYGNRAGVGKLDSNEDLHTFVIGLIAEKPHISGKLVSESLAARFGADADLPDLRSVQRWLKRWKAINAEAYLALTNPDAWKNKHMAAFGSLSEGITRACQLWQLDSTPADLQLIDGRYSLVGVIDIGWRGFSLHVTKTCTAESVCQIMRRAIIEWGVPEAVKMDNGRDYASNRVASVLAGLNIEPRFSAPFSPWEKGNIERAFRTFGHSLMELLPGYTGHNVAEAQAIRARESFADRLFKKNEVIEIKLTAAELQEFCDRWCRDYYQHEEHEGLNGMTPFQRYAELRDVVRRIGDVRALDLLLGEGEMRTVQKKGLRVGGLTYIAPELALAIRKDVLVRIDDADIGRAVVYHEEQFLCIAECPDVLGVSRREIAIEAKRKQTTAIQAAKADMRAAKRKANTRDIAMEILDHKQRLNGSLSVMPAPNVIHMTPALEAASEAADALHEADTAPVSALPPVTIRDVDQVTELLRNEHAEDETAEGRFRRALDYLMVDEDQRNDIQRQFLRQHTTSAEFKGRWNVFEYFGPDAVGLPSEYAVLLPDGTERDRLIRAQTGE